ncbi:MAG: replication protein [Candidatus Nealsonbacteria bacterium]
MEEKKENKLIPNSTQIPNVISDLIEPRVPEGEVRCLKYICRRTYGFHKERDRISLTQFTDGLKNKDGKRLDYGAGLSRPSVVEALRNLIGANIVKVIKTSGGNYYEINLELFVNKDVEKVADEVVKKVNQLRKLTRIGKESKPKQVKLLNPQKKGKKGNKVIVSDKPTIWNLKEEIDKLLTDKRRDLQVIGFWIKERKFKPENSQQLQSLIKRNLRSAKLLEGYKNEDIAETIKVVQNTDWIKKITLETIGKFIDETISQKRKEGPKIIRFEQIKEDGQIKMRPIYEIQKNFFKSKF